MNNIKKLQFFLLFLLFLLFTREGYSQPAACYKFSDDLRMDMENDTTYYRMQMGATNYSISGYFRKAMEIYGPRPLSQKSLARFSPGDWKSVDARKYILKRSKKEQIIVINEAHTNSRHRNFTASLLKKLYKNGYRYLGLEALWNDKIVNQRKFVVRDEGFYTREPEFGNLIFEAIKLGFTVFGYEAIGDKSGEAREQEQAQNIMDFMASHPEGKLLIHCGHDHVCENELSYWGGRAMAGRLKKGLGTELFTVSQTSYQEGRLPFNSGRRKRKNVPVILRHKKDGQVFNGLGNSQTDLCIVYPKTNYVHGRPVWQTYRRKPCTIKTDTLKYNPVLMTAYRKGEYDQDGTPADIFEVSDSKRNTILFLSPGEYEIIFQNDRYEIIAQYSVSM